MKKLLYLLPLMLITLFAACDNSIKEIATYNINEPIFMDLSVFRTKAKVTDEVREIKKQGKICFYEGYLFIAEPNEGIHIIDNRNPSQPQNIGFIELLGNADLTILDDMLYADSFVDLVWFDISNPSSPQIAGRVEAIFPDALPSIPNDWGIDYEMCFGSKRGEGVIVGWEVKTRTEAIHRFKGGMLWSNGSLDYATSESKSGKNGSMSRFALYEGKLYSVINNYMSVIDLKSEIPQKIKNSVFIGWEVETIFSYKNYMYMGTPTGMLIYSLEDPLTPTYVSSITHFYGCDPVIVHNDLAYVTVHSGNNCGQDVNELFIVDVKDVNKPKKLATYNMLSPKGLGIDKDLLFLCDDGLKIFNITNADNLWLKSLKHIKGMNGYDLVAADNTLMMIAEDGIYQYDYSNLDNIKELSVIKFTNENNYDQ